jgi:hypothetical protein
MRIATEQEALGYKAWTLRVQGQIAAATAHGEQARQHFQHALRLARALEMQPLAAQCERDLASLAGTAGAGREEQENALAGSPPTIGN